jgi:regulator of cell morphogenesis and NO signaling
MIETEVAVMVQFIVESKVGEIVTIFPNAGDFFKLNRIDFCCGGNLSVKEAAEKRKISANELILMLN